LAGIVEMFIGASPVAGKEKSDGVICSKARFG
jgi:hypothetical protein